MINTLINPDEIKNSIINFCISENQDIDPTQYESQDKELIDTLKLILENLPSYKILIEDQNSKINIFIESLADELKDKTEYVKKILNITDEILFYIISEKDKYKKDLIDLITKNLNIDNSNENTPNEIFIKIDKYIDNYKAIIEEINEKNYLEDAPRRLTTIKRVYEKRLSFIDPILRNILFKEYILSPYSKLIINDIIYENLNIIRELCFKINEKIEELTSLSQEKEKVIEEIENNQINNQEIKPTITSDLTTPSEQTSTTTSDLTTPSEQTSTTTSDLKPDIQNILTINMDDIAKDFEKLSVDTAKNTQQFQSLNPFDIDQIDINEIPIDDLTQQETLYQQTDNIKTSIDTNSLTQPDITNLEKPNVQDIPNININDITKDFENLGKIEEPQESIVDINNILNNLDNISFNIEETLEEAHKQKQEINIEITEVEKRIELEEVKDLQDTSKNTEIKEENFITNDEKENNITIDLEDIPKVLDNISVMEQSTEQDIKQNIEQITKEPSELEEPKNQKNPEKDEIIEQESLQELKEIKDIEINDIDINEKIDIETQASEEINPFKDIIKAETISEIAAIFEQQQKESSSPTIDIDFNLDISNLDLGDINLENIDLGNIDLGDINLENINLENINLENINLENLEDINDKKDLNNIEEDKKFIETKKLEEEFILSNNLQLKANNIFNIFSQKEIDKILLMKEREYYFIPEADKVDTNKLKILYELSKISFNNLYIEKDKIFSFILKENDHIVYITFKEGTMIGPVKLKIKNIKL